MKRLFRTGERCSPLHSGARCSPLHSVFVLILFVITNAFSVVFAAPSKQVINVYNWSSYLPPQVIKAFEKETGIKVNYSTYDSNEILYTKLKADPSAAYDVVIPSTYYVSKMIRENMLQKIDHAKLPNLKYINSNLLNKTFDLKNQYSIPYLWGTTSIFINKKYYSAAQFETWKSFWNPKLEHKIALLDDVRDTFSIALKTLGYSINDRNPQHILQAYLKLKTLMPNILSFGSGGALQMYVNEDINVGMIDSGDAFLVKRENTNFEYIYPKDGAILWIDSMVIPAGAKHVENAYKFINFIMRPEIAKIISLNLGFSTPNLGALKLMPRSMREDRIFNPTQADLKNAETQNDVGDKAQRIYLKYWELLKLNV